MNLLDLTEIQRVDGRISREDIDRNIKINASVANTHLADIGNHLSIFSSSGDDSVIRLSIHFMDEPVGYANLWKEQYGEFHGYKVGSIGVREDFRGWGLGEKIYMILLEKGFGLFSSQFQTTHGEGIWKRLMQRSDVEVHRINEHSGKEVSDQADPWSFGILLYAKKKS